jgi:hypothetical protein
MAKRKRRSSSSGSKYVPAKYQTAGQREHTGGKGAKIPNKYLTKGQRNHK